MRCKVIIAEQMFNDFESMRKRALLAQAKASRKAIQEQSEANGLDKISMEEIVADIKEYRQANRLFSPQLRVEGC